MVEGLSMHDVGVPEGTGIHTEDITRDDEGADLEAETAKSLPPIEGVPSRVASGGGLEQKSRPVTTQQPRHSTSIPRRSAPISHNSSTESPLKDLADLAEGIGKETGVSIE